MVELLENAISERSVDTEFESEMDEPFEFECGAGQIVNKISSYHSNKKEVWYIIILPLNVLASGESPVPLFADFCTHIICYSFRATVGIIGLIFLSNLFN